MARLISPARKHFRECKTLGRILSSPVQKKKRPKPGRCCYFFPFVVFCQAISTAPKTSFYAHALHNKPHHLIMLRHSACFTTRCKRMPYIMPEQNAGHEISDNGGLAKNRRHTRRHTVGVSRTRYILQHFHHERTDSQPVFATPSETGVFHPFAALPDAIRIHSRRVVHGTGFRHPVPQSLP